MKCKGPEVTVCLSWLTLTMRTSKEASAAGMEEEKE